MHEATLPFGPRIGFRHRLVDAGKAVGDGDLDFLQSARFEARQELPVRLRRLLWGYGVADDQRDPIVVDAHRYVYGLLGHRIPPHRHVGGIEEKGEKAPGKRPFREALDVFDDRVGDRGDRRFRAIRLVDRPYGKPHLLVGHPAGIKLEYDGGDEARPPLVSGQRLRGVVPVPVPRDPHGYRSDRGLDGPLVGAVPGIAGIPSLEGVFAVAEEGSDLRPQKGFHGLLRR